MKNGEVWFMPFQFENTCGINQWMEHKEQSHNIQMHRYKKLNLIQQIERNIQS